MTEDYTSTSMYLTCVDKAKEAGLNLKLETRGYALYRERQLMGVFNRSSEIYMYLCGYDSGRDNIQAKEAK